MGEDQPFGEIPFPDHYKIGNVYSMIVFKLDIAQFEYAYRVDGPYDPKKGLIFDRSKILLDPYAKAVTVLGRERARHAAVQSPGGQGRL